MEQIFRLFAIPSLIGDYVYFLAIWECEFDIMCFKQYSFGVHTDVDSNNIDVEEINYWCVFQITLLLRHI